MPIMFRRGLFLLFFLCLAPLQDARAESFLNTLFPSIFGPPTKGPKPEETLIAPFADDVPADAKRLPMKERVARAREGLANTTPINQPHRSTKYIAEWLADAATDSLIIDPGTYADHQARMQTLFSPYGLQEYSAYLQSGGWLNRLQVDQSRLKAFAKEQPTLLNEGEFSGTYRWLFDVPITITAVPSNLPTYSTQINAQPFTQSMILRLQVGRTLDAAYKDGMMIERWTVIGGS